MTADAAGSPPAEVEITEALVRTLLQDQHPDLAGLPLAAEGEGWDNVMFRLGEDLALRLPRRAVADDLIRREQRWLPQLAPHLSLPVPAPVRTGMPGRGYPFAWSVLPWFEGETADLSRPDASEAPVLAGFLRAVHTLPLPPDPPANPVRDCPLTGKQADTERRMAILRAETDAITPQVERAWAAGLAAPVDLPKSWIAGDVHARNVLVRNGRFAAFIDWGDMCAGDPATDLASIWGLFGEADARRAAIEAYGVSAATLVRARGWAVFYGVILLETGRQDNPRHAKMGADTLARLTEDLG
ncbi:MAG: aminoglycoside phosphotransferase family protein [Hyphomonas sp.]|nr:aminoglycoside phosphotransferase family protein [Hyphomonas sp.]